MFKFIIQPLQLLLDGVVGKDRQAKRSLTKKLHYSLAECNRLQRQQGDSERSHEKLKRTGDRIIQRQKQLQGEYAQLQKRCRVTTLAQEKAEKQWAIAASENKQLTAKQSTLALQIRALEIESRQLVKLADDDEQRFLAQ